MDLQSRAGQHLKPGTCNRHRKIAYHLPTKLPCEACGNEVCGHATSNNTSCAATISKETPAQPVTCCFLQHGVRSTAETQTMATQLAKLAAATATGTSLIEVRTTVLAHRSSPKCRCRSWATALLLHVATRIPSFCLSCSAFCWFERNPHPLVAEQAAKIVVSCREAIRYAGDTG